MTSSRDDAVTEVLQKFLQAVKVYNPRATFRTQTPVYHPLESTATVTLVTTGPLDQNALTEANLTLPKGSKIIANHIDNSSPFYSVVINYRSISPWYYNQKIWVAVAAIILFLILANAGAILNLMMTMTGMARSVPHPRSRVPNRGEQ
jgi:hypothetical protein